ncbi:MAG: disulfide bond formation protein B [Betaproteobacteria bacterium]|nr:disulfide bond formation protein B [Betaproteobacteria bacterium]
MERINARWVFAGIALLCLLLLTAAWYAQYGPAKQQPCPLCILQRYAYIALGMVCAVAAVAARPGRIAMGFAALADMVASIGVVIALWQVTKGADMTSCATDPVGVFVNGLPTVNWWPEYFFANGGCADVYPPLFGLTVPVWSLIWFLGFSMALAGVLVAEARRAQHR